jgi:hypothetical protein
MFRRWQGLFFPPPEKDEGKSPSMIAKAKQPVGELPGKPQIPV